MPRRTERSMDINKYSPKFKLKNSDLLHLADLSSEEIFELLYAAKVMKKKYKVGENVNFLHGKTVGLLFGNVSTRTRVSFELGIRQLGGDYIFLPKGETQLSRGESVKDTAAMLGRFGLSALVLRGFNDAELEDFASYSDIPVVNGISDTSHPLQVLSDLFTVWEKKGRLQNLKLAYIGDGNNVANSLIIGCSKCDMNVAIASPSGYSPARSIVERGMQFGDILITDSVAEAVKDADIVYTDVFISMNDEDDEKKKAKLTISDAPNLFRCLQKIQRDEKRPDVYAKQPHSLTHDPDSLRCFCVYWTLPADMKKEYRRVKWEDDLWEDYYNADAEGKQYLINKYGNPM